MKTWKKATALVLCCAMLTPFAACKEPENPNPNPGPNPPANGPLSQEQATQVGTSLASALKGHFENAKTIKLQINQSSLMEESYWEMNEDVLEEDDYYQESESLGIITIAKTETGYNLKSESTNKYRNEASGEWETYIDLGYIIDGYSYYYDEENEYYIKEEIEFNLESVTETLDLVFDGIALTQTEQAAFYQALGTAFGKTFTVENKVATVSYDGTAVINDLKTYINEIDPETKTIEGIFDDVLKEIDATLTTAKLLSEIEDLGDKTLPQALEAIDVWLYDEYDTTLQGIVDKVTDDPRTATLVTNVMLMMSGVNKDDITTENQAEIDDMIAAMKEFTVASLITEDMEDVVVYDFVVQMVNAFLAQMPSDSDEPMQVPFPATLEDAMATINMLLDQTLNVVLEEGMFDYAKTMINGIAVNELSCKNSLTYDSSFAITKLVSEMKIDVAMTTPSIYDETKSDTSDNKITQNITIELSKTATTIALPADAEIYVDPSEKFSNDNYDNGNRKLALDSIFLGDGTGRIYFAYHDYDLDESLWEEGDIGGAEFTYEVSEDGNTITCTITGLIRYYEGVGLSQDITQISDWMNGDLTFELIYNESTGTWTTNLPETIPNQN